MEVFLKWWFLHYSLLLFDAIVAHADQVRRLFIDDLLLGCFLLLLEMQLHLLHQLFDIVGLVSVDETEFLKVHFLFPIVVYHAVHSFEVLEGQADSTDLTAGNEFLKRQGTVEVNVKVPESLTVVFELLLYSVMDLSQELLNFG